jgi:hypothetical protein
MGQGDPGRQHQGGVIRATPAKYSARVRSASIMRETRAISELFDDLIGTPTQIEWHLDAERFGGPETMINSIFVGR